jgi:hypothetical protein
MIHRNQTQIDLLSSNNTQLVGYLLQTGMIQNVRELNLTPAVPPLLNGFVMNGHVMPILPSSEAQPQRRGKKPKALLEAMGEGAVPKKKRKRASYIGNKKESDLSQSDYMLKFAIKNNGRLVVSDFRAHTHTQDFAPSFFETTIYSVLQRLVLAGKMVKVGVGHYELVKTKTKKAATAN